MKKYILTNIFEYFSEHKILLNSKFLKWFGDSKMKDNDGKPIVFYHGTTKQFYIFDDRKKGTSTDGGLRGRGFYFTANKKTAESYGKNIIKVFLKIENPFDLHSFNSLQEIADLLDIDVSILYERGRDSKYHSISVKTDFSGVFSGAVKEKGYDGIIHGQEIICFKANQIKSINNDGSWDVDDDNIFS